MRQEPGGHIVPLAGVVHGGGGRVPCPIAKFDVYHGAGSLGEVARPRSKQPSYVDCEGDLLPCRKPVDPEAQVLGRRVFRLFAGAVDVALHTYDFTRLAKRCAARKFLTSYLGFCQLYPDSNGSDQPHHLFLFRRTSPSRQIVVQISRCEIFKLPQRLFCPWMLPSDLGASDSFCPPSVHQTTFPCFEI